MSVENRRIDWRLFKSMKAQEPLLLIPVENQVREFDPKLLLACVAAQRGYSSVVGPRREVEFLVTSFPRSIFISKDLRSGNGKFFRILKMLGHLCVAWDEEALIHPRPDIYSRTRFSHMALKYVSHLFAWGQNNAELWRKFPKLLAETPIHITGNPRGDMLRPEIRLFFENRVEELRKTYGDFILINTNFSGVNNITPIQNLFFPTDKPGEKLRSSRGARGMSREYAERANNHIQAIFEDFKQLIPLLDQAFPDFSIVVRPHPSENPHVYHHIASQCKRVHVTNEGNVVPWLMVTKALVHNGCTTGLEAFATGVPAVSYRATVDEYIDNNIARVPNMLSHQCFNFEELRVTLENILASELGVINGEEPKHLFNQYFAALEGPLACERIIDVLEDINWSEMPRPGLSDQLKGLYGATRRKLLKQIKSYLPNASIPPELQRHRYPPISLEEVRSRVSRLRQVLGHSGEPKIERIGKQTYRIGG
jgi:surface carbohydrate biosynthesis protein